MSIFSIATESFKYYWRNNLVLALGIAAATAVLTGALIVGDSMRTSLRKLALDRLGTIDQMVVADGFFREELVESLRETDGFKSSYSIAEPAILFPSGTVQIGDEFSSDTEQSVSRVSKVGVFGVRNSFWKLGEGQGFSDLQISDRQVVVNQTLADQLGLRPNDSRSLTLRIPKPSQLPPDSSVGKRNDLVESLVELEVSAVVEDKSIGRFGLHVSQVDSPNIFVPMELLQDSLARTALAHKDKPQANVIFLALKDDVVGSAPEEILGELDPDLGDFGLSLKEVNQLKADGDETVFEYFSLSSDRLVLSDPIAAAIKEAFPDALEVYTYLANDICLDGSPSGIPFSMVSAIDIGDEFPLLDIEDKRIDSLGKFDIVLNEWAAEDLGVKVGDAIRLYYFEPEATHGVGDIEDAFFEVKAIAKFSEPDAPFRIRRRKVTPAQFLSESPTLANDPDLTPEVPGLTDAESIEKWDLPFATADKLRAEDDDYWNYYRTTPKAFISLDRGQELWKSRFGKVTSFRIPNEVSLLEAEKRILQRLRSTKTPIGFTNVPIREQAIAASSGSTPFDVLFLALSMFVIGSALILVALLFRLTLQRRADQSGALMALGFCRGLVVRTLLCEMLFVAILGVVLGILLGIAYAWLMILGLKTWWLGAISKPILEMQISFWVLAIGAVCGLLICFLTIVFTVRGMKKVSIRELLGGDFELAGSVKSGRFAWQSWAVVGFVLGAIALSIVASFLGGEPQAGAFMGSGFLVLAAALLMVYQRLWRSANSENSVVAAMSLRGLASKFASRNPLRTTLTIGLVSVAAFLIMAVSSFRLSPSDEGTAGFELLATSDQPVFDRLDEVVDRELTAFSLRVKLGEDASCTNLYQSTQPQVIGVPDDFVTYFDKSKNAFRWSASIAERKDESNNPWWLLSREFEDGAIPVVIDKNTAN